MMSEREPKPLFSRISLSGLFDAGFAILAAITLVSFMGRFSWVFELASHFRVQVLALLFACAACYAARKRFCFAALASVLGAMCLPALFDAYVGHGQVEESAGSSFKTIIMHVNPSHGKFDDAVALLRSERPTFVVMEDVSPDWEAIVKKEISAMPDARFVCRHGTGFLSMRPWDRVDNAGITSWGFPGLKITYSAPELTIFALHVPAPISASWRQERMSQFRKLALEVNEAKRPSGVAVEPGPGPVLVMGDLNCSPWSPLCTDLIEETGLHNTRMGFGIRPTWPSIMPPFMIPIDHVLVTKEHFRVLDVHVGPYLGSDHYPLVVTMTWVAGKK
jgi:endonuclease/exonuclease/phosphatase (EEP) superfamily protein YafD